MIEKIIGFKITGPNLTEDRMAMTTAERNALDPNRKVFGLTTWDKDEEAWYFMNESLEWVKVEMSGDFAISGTVTVDGGDLFKNGNVDEWIITFNRQVLPFNKFERNPNVILYQGEIQVIPDVKVTETQIQITVNEETDYKYILN